MRIIGGKARGIKLEAGEQEAVRPTTDRVKETVFNIIGDMNGLVVIDFFAGSGALGLEALSRGAEKVYFIEKDAKTCKVIAENLAKVEKSMGQQGKSVILQSDFKKSFEKIFGKVDFILADPPYMNNCELAAALLMSDGLAKICHKKTKLVLEHTMGFVIPQVVHWEQVRRKDFGLTAYTFWNFLGDINER